MSPECFAKLQVVTRKAVRRWMHNNGDAEDYIWIHSTTQGRCELCLENGVLAQQAKALHEQLMAGFDFSEINAALREVRGE